MNGGRRTLLVSASILALSCNSDRKIAELEPDWAYAFVDTCIATDQLDTSTWQQIDTRLITFRIPSDFNPSGGVMIDGEGASFDAGKRTFSYCARCAPATGDPSCFRCREKIGGRDGYIVRGRGSDGRYFTYIAWPRPQSGTIVIGSYSPDADSDKEALAAIRTVEFKPAFYKPDR